VPLTVKQYIHKITSIEFINGAYCNFYPFSAFNDKLAILLRGAQTSEEKLNHAVHFDGVV
jgi:hypothetical protein